MLLPDGVVQLIAQIQEPRHLPRDDLVARLRQIDCDRTFDTAGCPGNDRDAIAEIDCLLDIVGDKDEARSGRVAHALQFVLQSSLGHGIERCKRLVHQQHGRTQSQRARDLHALLHAAGKLPRIVVVMPLEADQAERLSHPLLDFASRQLAFEPEGDVAGDSTPLQQRMRIVLKDNDDVRWRAVNKPAIDTYRASRAGRQSAEHAQQRCLARARRSDNGQEFAAAQLQRDIRQDAAQATLVRQLNRHVPAGENEIGRCCR